MLFFVGINILGQHICPDASYDANRVNEPAFSPEIRIRVLKELTDWMDDPYPEHRGLLEQVNQSSRRAQCVGLLLEQRRLSNPDNLIPDHIPQLERAVESMYQSPCLGE